jgi:hypothetical protein
MNDGRSSVEMNRGRRARTALTLMTVTVLLGCGGDPPSVPTSGAEQQRPSGVVAIGHSGLTGESSDPQRPGEDALENSWATGTTPEVKSVYLRLSAVRPETKGHVSNRAMGGAVAQDLPDQARAALADVPTPALVIVQTIDNDIMCDGGDAAHVPEFGEAVAETLKIINEASPESKILIVGQPGRPTVAGIRADAKRDPATKAETTGTGPCDFFDPNGEINAHHVTELRNIIEGYEAEQARVCAAAQNCYTDEGNAATFVEGPDDRILGHWNVAGHAKVAALFWPSVVPLFPL